MKRVSYWEFETLPETANFHPRFPINNMHCLWNAVDLFTPDSEIGRRGFGPNSVKLKWDIKRLRRDKTVRGEISAIFGGNKVELRQTRRAVTPFGGSVVWVEFLRRV